MKTEKQNITIQVLDFSLKTVNDQADHVLQTMEAAGYVPLNRCTEYNSAVFRYSTKIFFAEKVVNA
jgi:hypothetical protein